MVEVRGKPVLGFEEILTPQALRFIDILVRLFRESHCDLLRKRAERQLKIDNGEMPNFLPETKNIREGDWKISQPPAGFFQPGVEITGPASNRKMVVNALNSGADFYMADAEDSESPQWENILAGQINLRDAVRAKTGDVFYTSPEGKIYRSAAKRAVLMFRPRGLHLPEKHVLLYGKPVPASLFDFGLYFYSNAQALEERGQIPVFYLPKIESHLEARWWSDVFHFAEAYVGIPFGKTKAVVLIETILAAFEMDEILHELKDYSAGLNFGRWDYIFSFIKKFSSHPEFVLPDRVKLTMDSHFLTSGAKLLVKTCLRRGAPAIGGMSAYIPVKDPGANNTAFAKVRADKAWERKLGFQRAWVAHPGLVEVVKEIFRMPVPKADQLNLENFLVTAEDLLKIPKGEVTEAGLRTNVSVYVKYQTPWLQGIGCVPINDLMEDTATAEICRAQIWQWIKYGKFDVRFVRQLIAEEVEKINSPEAELAGLILDQLVTAPKFVEFLTIPAYECILEPSNLKGAAHGP